MLDPFCQLRKFDPGQIFLDGRMGRRLADEQEMPARRLHRLADRLAGVEVVAEIDGIEPCVARAMGGEPTSRRHALAVLLVVRPSCGTTNSGSSGTTRLWPGATSVAATSAWKYSVVPPLRLRVEQHAQCSLVER